MQTWAKRGIQTALVTGGLLMLGTGIASADEDVNPDKPASPLDGSLSIPVNIQNNSIGSPLGQLDVPNVSREVKVDASDASGNLPSVASDALAPVTGVSDPLFGNRGAVDVVAPLDISGNAIGAIGNAAVTNDSSQSFERTRPMYTNGTGGFIASNVVDLDWAVPLQVTGNAVAGLGNASSTNNASQVASTTGDVGSNGTGGVLSGNVAAGQAATPVQVNGNAVAAGGTAASDSHTKSDATAGGALFTLGDGGAGSGTIGEVPAAIPVQLNNNAVGGAANTMTGSPTDNPASSAGGAVSKAAADASTNGVTATAGRQHDPAGGISAVTSGTNGLVAGTVAQTPVATPATVTCNAVAGVADSSANCEHTTEATAGGGNRTTGSGGVASGTVADSPAGVPAEVFSNAGAVGGNAAATDVNTVNTGAGGDSFTHGTGGAGSGTVLGPSASGPVDVFSNAGAGAGDATASTTNASNTTSGGFTGTSGDSSVGGGNTGTVPVTLPTEGFGNVVGGAGNATTSGTTEVKTAKAGGTTSTSDDAGLLAANAVQGAVAGPAQVIGDGAGVVGNTTSHVDTTNHVTAGGDSKATGIGGFLAGNIGQALVSLPAQAFADNATAGGVGSATGTVDTNSTAGGNATTIGTGGAGSGNVASVPVGSVGQVFGDSAAAIGNSCADGTGTTSSTAAGDVVTEGSGGLLNGNVVTGQAMPIAQTPGDGVAGVGGLADGKGTNTTTVLSGGDVQTAGEGGTASGDLVNVPAAVIAQPFGDAVSAIGADATGAGNSTTSGAVGGASNTHGSGLLSGLNGTLPAGANLSAFGVPVEVIAQAMADATNVSSYSVGETDPVVDMALDGSKMGGLPITSLPSLPKLSDNSRAANPGPGLGQLSTLTGVLGLLKPLTGALPGGGLTGGLPGGGLAGGLPGGGLTQGLTGGLTSGNIAGTLPGAAGPGDAGSFSGTLPLDMVGSLPGLAGGVPGASHVTDALAHLPVPSGALAQSRSGAPLPAIGNLGAPLPGVGNLGGLDQVTALIQGLLGGGVTGGLPALPAVPSVPGLPGAGQAQLPSLPGVPALPGGGDAHLPAVPGLPALPVVGGSGSHLPALPAVGAPTLQAPTLGHLPTPALSGLDTSSLLNTGGSSTLADTKSKLDGLFGRH